MERVAVGSSVLQSIGYDPDAEILEIEFNNGNIYQYLNVPEHVHRSLLDAPSHGQYFNANIKGHYPESRI